MKILIGLCAWSVLSVAGSFGLATLIRAGRQHHWELGSDALLTTRRRRTDRASNHAA